LDQHEEHARQLLVRVGVLRHPCDLDLLIFFARHPRTLMTSEQLAALMGYGLQQTAESRDMLLKAELITRTLSPARAARMYVFADGTEHGWLPPLLEFASTRHGRLAMRRVLARLPARHTNDSRAQAQGAAARAQYAVPGQAKSGTDDRGTMMSDAGVDNDG
jgi:hypothetical protein